MDAVSVPTLLEPSDSFAPRHIGPSDADVRAMLERLGVGSLDELAEQTVPASIRRTQPLALGEPRGEHELLAELRQTMARKTRSIARTSAWATPTASRRR